MIGPSEREVINLLSEAYNKFASLAMDYQQGGHPDDTKDFCYLIHRLQDLVAARVGYRFYRNTKD